MWGKIVTEATFETNFNTQFPNTKTDVLIHLAQWQYWWWFWFSFLWVLYYLFLARTLRYRTLKFRPKIVSSFRPHGKWGDVIICILPVSWCANILINSNFLLKLLEWQAESSLFTIRIRGKQWYWVYKFDFRNFSDIISTPKNIGNNKWMFSFFGDLKTSDNYLHIIQMRAQNKWIKKYWIKNLGKFEQDEKSNINLIQDFFKIDTLKKDNNITFALDVNSFDKEVDLQKCMKNLISDIFPEVAENTNDFLDVGNDLRDISIYLNKENDLTATDKLFFDEVVEPTNNFLDNDNGVRDFSIYLNKENSIIATDKLFFDGVIDNTNDFLDIDNDFLAIDNDLAKGFAIYLKKENSIIATDKLFFDEVVVDAVEEDTNTFLAIGDDLRDISIYLNKENDLTATNKPFFDEVMETTNNFLDTDNCVRDRDFSIYLKKENDLTATIKPVSADIFRVETKLNCNSFDNNLELQKCMKNRRPVDVFSYIFNEEVEVEEKDTNTLDITNNDLSLYQNKNSLANFILKQSIFYSEKDLFDADVADVADAGNFLSNTVLQNSLFLNSFKLLPLTQEGLSTNKISFLKNNFNFILKDFQRITDDLYYTSLLTFSTANTNLSHTEYNYNVFSFQEESNRVTKSLFGKPAPISLVKFPVTYIDSAGTKLLKFRYNDQNSKVTSRNMIKVPYFVFKQVRYKRRKSAFATAHIFYDSLGNEKSIKKNFSLNNQYSVEQDVKNPTRYYRMFKKNRVRSENMPVVVAKRLLRVKRTLVIPTHINITAITNSYDVVHSWFIPGLGLKMDCVPGRSTHHTFYVDNSGFYYGQCAEICGRYHHHMPIRVCALPFEHFLIWWQSIGLPKLLYPNKKYNMLKSHTFRKFVW